MVLNACSAGSEAPDATALAQAIAAPPLAGSGLSTKKLRVDVLTNSCGSNQAQAFFQVTNTGNESITLSDIKIKYWIYDTSGVAVVPQVFYGGCLTNRNGNPSCFHPVTDTNATASSFAPACGSDANHRANWEIAISTGDGTKLNPGESWNNLQAAVHLSSYANFAPGAGTWYSPCAGSPSYSANPSYAVYVNDELVYDGGVSAPPCRSPHGSQQLDGHISSQLAEAPFVAAVHQTKQVAIALGLPLRNRDALVALVADVSDPTSAGYGQYPSYEELVATYAPTQEDYNAAIAWARQRNLTVLQSYSHRLLLDVTGTVEDIERALYLNINYYRRPDGTLFYGPDREPSLDLANRVLDVNYLNDYVVKNPSIERGPGRLTGDDFRAAYAPCATPELDGRGQCIAIISWAETFDPQDIEDYEALAGIEHNGTVVAVPVAGFDTTAPTSGTASTIEVAADIEMAISMAPGADLRVYEANEVLSAIAAAADVAANPRCNQISISWGGFWTTFPDTPSLYQIASEWAPASGLSLMIATGDYGAFGRHQPDVSVNQEASTGFLTEVGGTVLSMGTDNDSYGSEVAWEFGGGGVEAYAALPSYQEGLDMSRNGGSITRRNVPDLALSASEMTVVATFPDPDVEGSGAEQGRVLSVGGTSLSTPLLAGMVALANQRRADLGRSSLGFLNPILYAIGNEPSTYAATFHDVVEGANRDVDAAGNDSGLIYSAVPGYDLVTGWGSPKCGLITELGYRGADAPRLRIRYQGVVRTFADYVVGSSYDRECRFSTVLPVLPEGAEIPSGFAADECLAVDDGDNSEMQYHCTPLATNAWEVYVFCKETHSSQDVMMGVTTTLALWGGYSGFVSANSMYRLSEGGDTLEGFFPTGEDNIVLGEVREMPDFTVHTLRDGAGNHDYGQLIEASVSFEAY